MKSGTQRDMAIRRESVASPAHADLSSQATEAVGPSRRSERSVRQRPALPTTIGRRASARCKCFAVLIIGPHDLVSSG